MGFFDAVSNFFTGGASGVVGSVVDAITKYFPPSMSDSEKAQMQLVITQELHNHEIEIYKLANAQDAETNQRIRDLEGTATDLKSVPFIGPLVLLFRGIQRPAWGFAVMYFDYKAISGSIGRDIFEMNSGGWSPEGLALIIMNFLVLGFLFGERALQNIMPLVTDLVKARKS